MEHDFPSRSRAKISGSNGISEKVVLFFRMEYFKRKFVFISSSKPSFICTYGKRDSGTKFTNRKFCLPFAETVERLVCLCEW